MGKGGDSKGKDGERAIEFDNLYVRGLPGALTPEQMKAVFSQYATVVSCKLLPMQEGKDDAAGFVRCKTDEEAKWLIDNLNGKVPNGLATPVQVRYAGQPPAKGDDKGKSKGGFGKGKDSKGKGKDSKGKGKDSKGKGKDGPPSASLYVKGVPGTYDETMLKDLFSQFVTVFHAKSLPVPEGKSTGAGFVKMSEEDAEWCVMNLKSESFTDLGQPELAGITLSYAEDAGGKGKDGKSKGKVMEMQSANIEDSDNLYIKGLAPDTQAESLQAALCQFGIVTSLKLLEPRPRMDDGKDKGKKGKGKSKPQPMAALIRMASVADAKQLIAQLDGKPLPGTWNTLTITCAGAGMPLAQKAKRKMETGEKIVTGQVVSYDAEKKFGKVWCEEVYNHNGDTAYCHHTVLQACRAGPGDTIIFFLFWKGNNPSVSQPAIRIGATWTPECKLYALKGWFKGIADTEKGFGFVQSGDLKELFGKDVFVKKDVAEGVRPGWVCMNCNILEDKRDGGVKAQVMQMEACDGEWQPISSDMTISRTVEIPQMKGGWGAKGGGWGGDAWGGGCKGGFKGGCKGGCMGGKDAWGGGGGFGGGFGGGCMGKGGGKDMGGGWGGGCMGGKGMGMMGGKMGGKMGGGWDGGGGCGGGSWGGGGGGFGGCGGCGGCGGGGCGGVIVGGLKRQMEGDFGGAPKMFKGGGMPPLMTPPGMSPPMMSPPMMSPPMMGGMGGDMSMGMGGGMAPGMDMGGMAPLMDMPMDMGMAAPMDLPMDMGMAAPMDMPMDMGAIEGGGEWSGDASGGDGSWDASAGGDATWTGGDAGGDAAAWTGDGGDAAAAGGDAPAPAPAPAAEAIDLSVL